MQNSEMSKLQQIFLIKNSGGRAKFSGLTQGIENPWNATVIVNRKNCNILPLLFTPSLL